MLKHLDFSVYDVKDTQHVSEYRALNNGNPPSLTMLAEDVSSARRAWSTSSKELRCTTGRSHAPLLHNLPRLVTGAAGTTTDSSLDIVRSHKHDAPLVARPTASLTQPKSKSSRCHHNQHYGHILPRIRSTIRLHATREAAWRRS